MLQNLGAKPHEGLPHDRLADVRGNEERDPGAQSVSLQACLWLIYLKPKKAYPF